MSEFRMHPADLVRLADLIADRINNRPQLVNRATLARLTGLSESTLRRREKEGVLTPIRSGRRVQYDPSQAIDCLAAQSA